MKWNEMKSTCEQHSNTYLKKLQNKKKSSNSSSTFIGSSNKCLIRKKKSTKAPRPTYSWPEKLKSSAVAAGISSCQKQCTNNHTDREKDAQRQRDTQTERDRHNSKGKYN